MRFNRSSLFCITFVAALALGGFLAEQAAAQRESPRGNRGGERQFGPWGPGAPGGPGAADGVRGDRFFAMPGTFRHLLEPNFRIRDGAILAQQLDLDRSQRAIVQLLLEDHVTAYEEAAAELRDAVQRAPRPPFGRAMFGMAGGGGPQWMGGGEGRQWLGGEDGEMIVIGLGDDQPGFVGRIMSDVMPHLDLGNGEVREISIRIQLTDGEETIEIHGADDLPPEAQEQLDRVRSRIEQRRAARAEARERMRQRIEERRAAEEAIDRLDADQVTAIAKEFHATKEKLRAQFEQDVQALLTKGQAEAWPHAIALLRRMNHLRMGTLSGEQIDLTAVIRDLRMPSEIMERIESALSQYTIALDAVLAERTRTLERMDIESFEAMHAENWSRMLALDEQVTNRRVAVRVTNETFAPHIAQAMDSEEWSNAFISEVHTRTYPWTARLTQVDRLLARASERTDLSEEQQEALEAIAARYEVERTQADARAVEQLRDEEPMRVRRFIEMMQGIQDGGDPRELGRELFGRAGGAMRERMTVARDYISELRAVLPEDLFEGERVGRFEMREGRRRGGVRN